MTSNSAPAHSNDDASKPYISTVPDNIFFLIIPRSWRDSIKRFNKNVSTLKFVKSAETPELLKPLFEFLNNFFGCTLRGSSVGMEIASGVINFFSCMFLLAVIPSIMARNGYDPDNTTAIVALVCGVGNIASGIVSNLPIVIGPPTPITIYYISASLQSGLSQHQGNLVIVYTGIFFFVMGVVAPIGRFCARIIPDSVAIALTVGVGLISTLSGLSLLGLIKQGKFTLLELGDLDAQCYIGVSAIIFSAWAVIVRSRVSNLAGLVWGTFIWWASQDLWPRKITSVPILTADKLTSTDSSGVIVLIFEMFVLNLLTCFGLCKSLCTIGNLITKEGMVPNGRFLTITVSVMNIFSGLFNGPPIVVIADSGAGIRSGARTGLSTVVAGIMFLFAVFFGPFFSSIPPTGYATVLIMTGILQFKNVQTIDFKGKFAVPAFLTLTLIPFTNSIIAGLGIGVSTYVLMSLLTGQFSMDGKLFVNYYVPGYFPIDDGRAPSNSSDASNDGDVDNPQISALSNETNQGVAKDIELQPVDNPLATNYAKLGSQGPTSSKTIDDTPAQEVASTRRPSAHQSRGRRTSMVVLVEGMKSTELGGDVSGLLLNH